MKVFVPTSIFLLLTACGPKELSNRYNQASLTADSSHKHNGNTSDMNDSVDQSSPVSSISQPETPGETPKKTPIEAEKPSNYAATGPYRTKIHIGVGPSQGFTVFSPESEERKKFPVISWGNATYSFPTAYESIIKHIVSHGFIIVASRSSQTGSGTPILEGIDFILRENENSNSPYYERVNRDQIAVMGHSQGGGGALTAAGKDYRISTVVAIQPDCQFTARCVGIENSRAPTLIISSALDVLVPPLLVEQKVANILKTEYAFGIHRSANHMEPTEMGRGHFNEIITAWLNTHLVNFDLNKELFYGKNCGFCERNDFLMSRSAGLSKDLKDDSNTIGFRGGN